MSIINLLVPTSLGSQQVLIATIFHLGDGLVPAKQLRDVYHIVTYTHITFEEKLELFYQ